MSETTEDTWSWMKSRRSIDRFLQTGTCNLRTSARLTAKLQQNIGIISSVVELSAMCLRFRSKVAGKFRRELSNDSSKQAKVSIDSGRSKGVSSSSVIKQAANRFCYCGRRRKQVSESSRQISRRLDVRKPFRTELHTVMPFCWEATSSWLIEAIKSR